MKCVRVNFRTEDKIAPPEWAHKLYGRPADDYLAMDWHYEGYRLFTATRNLPVPGTNYFVEAEVPVFQWAFDYCVQGDARYCVVEVPEDRISDFASRVFRDEITLGMEMISEKAARDLAFKSEKFFGYSDG
jgi:hypothetical protein